VVPRHCRITDRENQQDQAHHYVRGRNSRAVAQEHGDRGAAGHGCQRRSCGDDEEGNGEHPKATVPQLMRVAPGDVGGGCGIFRG
jgi:hypothetical protein